MKTTAILIFNFCLGLAGSDLAIAGPTDDSSSLPVIPPRRSGPRVAVVTPSSREEHEEPLVRLNFRGAPLEKVLSYLSDAAGYTIVLKATIAGTIDVWNAQPLTRVEALEVLNAALIKNGVVAIASGRRLEIVSREEAMKSNTPVEYGARSAEIAASETVATHIIPLSHVNAPQLIRDLAPLIPKTADVSASEGGNVIVVTDTQANIRHLVQIIEAIETSVSGAANVRVFPLRSADAKSVASIIKDLFAPDSSGAGGRGGGGFGGPSSRFSGRLSGGVDGETAGGPSRAGSRGPSGARVVAVADDRSNSVVVTAADDLMETVESLMAALDVTVDDVTELRVFRLKNADPVETANLFGELYPEDPKPNIGGAGAPTGGARTILGFGVAPSANPVPAPVAGDPGERAKKQGRVIAVADPRTYSLVVSTSHELMRQIEVLIARLDAEPGRKQVVRIYALQNADPLTVQQVLQDVYPTPTSGGSRARTGSAQTSPLIARAQSQAQSAAPGTFGGSPGGMGGSGPGGARLP